MNKHNSQTPKIDTKKSTLLGNPSLDLFYLDGLRSKRAVCVAGCESAFDPVLSGLTSLGFETTIYDDLDLVFQSVSLDPDEWGLVIIRLDQHHDVTKLASYVRLFRLLDTRVPILLFSCESEKLIEASDASSFAEIVFREPTTVSALAEAIVIAVAENIKFGSRICELPNPAAEQQTIRFKSVRHPLNRKNAINR